MAGLEDLNPDGNSPPRRSEGATLIVKASGFGLVHVLLFGFLFLVFGIVILDVVPGFFPGPLTWQNQIYIGVPVATAVYLFIVFGALRGKATKARISDSGVEFSRRWMKPVFIPWESLKPPQSPPIVREVSFSKEGEGQEYWVPPNIASAILSHPACSRSGVAPQVLQLLGLGDGSRADAGNKTVVGPKAGG